MLSPKGFNIVLIHKFFSIKLTYKLNYIQIFYKIKLNCRFFVYFIFVGLERLIKVGLYEKIKVLAKQNKISIRQLEEKLGFGNGVINRWRTNTPGVDKVKSVAAYFKVSTDYLLGLTDIPEQIHSEQSMAKQVMMRMDTEGLSEEEKNEIEDEMERFFAWRLEEIKKERENTK